VRPPLAEASSVSGRSDDILNLRAARADSDDMKMSLRPQRPHETPAESPLAAVMAHLAAGRRADETLEPGTVRTLVVNDAQRALSARLAQA